MLEKLILVQQKKECWLSRNVSIQRLSRVSFVDQTEWLLKKLKDHSTMQSALLEILFAIPELVSPKHLASKFLTIIYLVYGGGAPEVACALAVSDASDDIASLDQWGMRSFAKALESVPMALAENSGLSPVETLTNLRSEQRTTKNPKLGVDCLHTGKKLSRDSMPVTRMLTNMFRS